VPPLSNRVAPMWHGSCVRTPPLKLVKRRHKQLRGGAKKGVFTAGGPIAAGVTFATRVPQRGCGNVNRGKGRFRGFCYGSSSNNRVHCRPGGGVDAVRRSCGHVG